MHKTPTVLIVCQHSSIHTARWVKLLQGLDLHVFPIDGSPPHAHLAGVTLHAANATASSPMIRLGREGESDQAVPAENGPAALAALIDGLRPDLIHSMGFQPSGYLVLAARERLEKSRPTVSFPTWLATNWGSDIYFYGRQAGHAQQIRRLCSSIDLYSCECRRDVQLGRQFGYRGPELPVLPCSGGFAFDEWPSVGMPPSRRNLVMVKGYDHFAGRALTSLAALESLCDLLYPKYDVVVFSADRRPRDKVEELAQRGTLKISVLPPTSHDQMLRRFSSARVYLGIGLSDGISSAALEAMAMGAFPIQSNTACCDEWFEDGRSGFAVSPTNLEEICSRLKQALTDDRLVDEAAVTNRAIVEARLDARVLKSQTRDFYRRALAFRRHTSDMDGRSL